MIEVTLDKEVTFDLPEGEYPAQITGVRPFNKHTGKGKQDWVRILFEVEVPGMRDLECRAGKNFLLSFKQGSELRNFLSPVLKPGFFKENSARSIDLEKLVVGIKGEIQLHHFCGEDYVKPMVVVDAFELVEGKD